MKTSVNLDDDLAAEVEKTATLTKEKPSTVLRMAIRAGLPIVANSLQETRPEGCFSDDYRNCPQERIDFENAMGKAAKQSPER